MANPLILIPPLYPHRMPFKNRLYMAVPLRTTPDSFRCTREKPYRIQRGQEENWRKKSIMDGCGAGYDCALTNVFCASPLVASTKRLGMHPESLPPTWLCLAVAHPGEGSRGYYIADSIGSLKIYRSKVYTKYEGPTVSNMNDHTAGMWMIIRLARNSRTMSQSQLTERGFMLRWSPESCIVLQ